MLQLEPAGSSSVHELNHDTIVSGLNFELNSSGGQHQRLALFNQSQELMVHFLFQPMVEWYERGKSSNYNYYFFPLLSAR